MAEEPGPETLRDRLRARLRLEQEALDQATARASAASAAIVQADAALARIRRRQQRAYRVLQAARAVREEALGRYATALVALDFLDAQVSGSPDEVGTPGQARVDPPEPAIADLLAELAALPPELTQG